jgi:rhodanese-related sulfurtransferase
MPNLEIDGATALAWMSDDVPTTLLDIREPYETARGIAEGAVLIPMNSIPGRLDEVPRERLVVYCAAGARSYGVSDWLRQNGRPDAYSLSGGLSAYIRAGGKPA